MKLSELLQRVEPSPAQRPLSVSTRLPSAAASEAECTNLTDDSRQVGPGTVFVAVRGEKHDGHAYIQNAVHAGAVAVIAERFTEPVDIPTLVVDDSREWLGRACAVWTGLDDLQQAGGMRAIGVTGTNGKSTTAYLVQAMLTHAGQSCALFGTVAYDLVGRSVPAPLTTPPPMDLCRMMVEAASYGAAHVVMEASSHSLDQRRVHGVRFDVGVFTNLTGDHLDYHGTMERYLLAKKRLFDLLPRTGTAVVNADDTAAERLTADCPARIIRYRLAALARSASTSGPTAGADDRRQELVAECIEMTSAGTTFGVVLGRQTNQVRSALVGRHNVQNLLAAIGAGLGIGLTLEQACRGVEQRRNVRGRLETVHAEGREYCVVVDYAHTDDALRNVLTALRPLTPGRLKCVFGCGGDRDRTKRPRMARVAAELADDIIVTSDNPRTESPEAIIKDIGAGFAATELPRCTFITDRRAAIRAAIGSAVPGDTVLIAGKGHEDYQIIGTHKHHFDDVEEARAAM